MDFHLMKRKELQALCKHHKIPANLTNLEMATWLTSLFKVEEKVVQQGRSCLKNLDEVLGNDDEKGVVREAKKVRFSPHNETFEFEVTDPRALRLAGRRKKSVLINTRSKNRSAKSGDLVILGEELVEKGSKENDNVEVMVGSEAAHGLRRSTRKAGNARGEIAFSKGMESDKVQGRATRSRGKVEGEVSTQVEVEVQRVENSKRSRHIINDPELKTEDVPLRGSKRSNSTNRPSPTSTKEGNTFEAVEGQALMAFVEAQRNKGLNVGDRHSRRLTQMATKGVTVVTTTNEQLTLKRALRNRSKTDSTAPTTQNRKVARRKKTQNLKADKSLIDNISSNDKEITLNAGSTEISLEISECYPKKRTKRSSSSKRQQNVTKKRQQNVTKVRPEVKQHSLEFSEVGAEGGQVVDSVCNSRCVPEKITSTDDDVAQFQNQRQGSLSSPKEKHASVEIKQPPLKRAFRNRSITYTVAARTLTNKVARQKKTQNRKADESLKDNVPFDEQATMADAGSAEITQEVSKHSSKKRANKKSSSKKQQNVAKVRREVKQRSLEFTEVGLEGEQAVDFVGDTGWPADKTTSIENDVQNLPEKPEFQNLGRDTVSSAKKNVMQCNLKTESKASKDNLSVVVSADDGPSHYMKPQGVEVPAGMEQFEEPKKCESAPEHMFADVEGKALAKLEPEDDISGRQSIIKDQKDEVGCINGFETNGQESVCTTEEFDRVLSFKETSEQVREGGSFPPVEIHTFPDTKLCNATANELTEGKEIQSGQKGRNTISENVCIESEESGDDKGTKGKALATNTFHDLNNGEMLPLHVSSINKFKNIERFSGLQETLEESHVVAADDIVENPAALQSDMTQPVHQDSKKSTTPRKSNVNTCGQDGSSDSKAKLGDDIVGSGRTAQEILMPTENDLKNAPSLDMVTQNEDSDMTTLLDITTTASNKGDAQFVDTEEIQTIELVSVLSRGPKVYEHSCEKRTSSNQKSSNKEPGNVQEVNAEVDQQNTEFSKARIALARVDDSAETNPQKIPLDDIDIHEVRERQEPPLENKAQDYCSDMMEEPDVQGNEPRTGKQFPSDDALNGISGDLQPGCQRKGSDGLEQLVEQQNIEVAAEQMFGSLQCGTLEIMTLEGGTLDEKLITMDQNVVKLVQINEFELDAKEQISTSPEITLHASESEFSTLDRVFHLKIDEQAVEEAKGNDVQSSNGADDAEEPATVQLETEARGANSFKMEVGWPFANNVDPKEKQESGVLKSMGKLPVSQGDAMADHLAECSRSAIAKKLKQVTCAQLNILSQNEMHLSALEEKLISGSQKCEEVKDRTGKATEIAEESHFHNLSGSGRPSPFCMNGNDKDDDLREISNIKETLAELHVVATDNVVLSGEATDCTVEAETLTPSSATVKESKLLGITESESTTGGVSYDAVSIGGSLQQHNISPADGITNQNLEVCFCGGSLVQDEPTTSENRCIQELDKSDKFRRSLRNKLSECHGKSCFAAYVSEESMQTWDEAGFQSDCHTNKDKLSELLGSSQLCDESCISATIYTLESQDQASNMSVKEEETSICGTGTVDETESHGVRDDVMAYCSEEAAKTSESQSESYKTHYDEISLSAPIHALEPQAHMDEPANCEYVVKDDTGVKESGCEGVFSSKLVVNDQEIDHDSVKGDSGAGYTGGNDSVSMNEFDSMQEGLKEVNENEILPRETSKEVHGVDNEELLHCECKDPTEDQHEQDHALNSMEKEAETSIYGTGMVDETESHCVGDDGMACCSEEGARTSESQSESYKTHHEEIFLSASIHALEPPQGHMDERANREYVLKDDIGMKEIGCEGVISSKLDIYAQKINHDSIKGDSGAEYTGGNDSISIVMNEFDSMQEGLKEANEKEILLREASKEDNVDLKLKADPRALEEVITEDNLIPFEINANNIRSVLIHATPRKQLPSHNMKENSSAMKGKQVVDVTAARPVAKRRPLEDLHM